MLEGRKFLPLRSLEAWEEPGKMESYNSPIRTNGGLESKLLSGKKEEEEEGRRELRVKPFQGFKPPKEGLARQQ